MTILPIKQIYEQYIARLSLTEIKQLLALIQTKVATAETDSLTRRRWSEIAGTGVYPLVGEDAQDWVTRTRQEADTQRTQQWVSNEIR